MKRGILIDVVNETVKEVFINDYKDIYGYLNCELFDIVNIDENNDVFVDDEGLLNLNEKSKFFMIDSYSQPLAGNGLVLGINNYSGESIDTTKTVDDIKNIVTFLNIQNVLKSCKNKY